MELLSSTDHAGELNLNTSIAVWYCAQICFYILYAFNVNRSSFSVYLVVFYLSIGNDIFEI